MEKPIRVLHVFGRLNAGGAQSRTMDIYRSIDRTQVQFDFVVHSDEQGFYSGEVNSLGGKIHILPRFTGRNFFTYSKSWDQLFKNNPQYKIIHGHQTSTAFIYLKIAKKNGLRVRIAHSRNSDKSSIVKKYTSKLAKSHASDLLAVSKLAAVSEFGKQEVENGNVSIIPNAIQTRKYLFNEKVRIKKRKEIGVEKSFVVGHIGRFQRQKNHEFLLQVFKNILEYKKEAKLLLIGDGVLREEIQDQIEKLGLKNSVILTGIRKDVNEVLQVMDILLFPSLYEGLPGVILEAQAAGLPCVISDSITDEVKVTELVEYISLNKGPKYWADTVLKNLSDCKRRNTYKEIAEAGYDIESVAKWYQQFYLESL